MEENKIFEKPPDVIEREMDGEVVLLDLNTGVYFSLNELGAELWGMLDGKRRVGEMVDWVVENYEVERKVAENDVGELLEDLHQENLIKEAGS